LDLVHFSTKTMNL